MDGNVKPVSLLELSQLFLKLGLTAFGGPIAHIAIMRKEVVEKRKWLSDQEFLDIIGATNLIPGPNSTEVAIHIGKEKAGWKGLITSGLCFILPAVAITILFAWLYKEYSELPNIRRFIYGIQPVILIVIIFAVYPLLKTAVNSTFLLFILLVVLLSSFFGFSELALLLSAGILGATRQFILSKKSSSLNSLSIFPMWQMGYASLPIAFKLFLIFLKVGAILYGSGYVLFAFLDSELVASGLLSRKVLIDAITVGQFTPGPVFSSVTFIGYQLAGFKGAISSTVGIFLPAFIFVAALNPIVKLLRTSKIFGSFLDAVNTASVAVIIVVCLNMARETINDWRTYSLMAISVVIMLLCKKVNTFWIILGASILGYLLSLV